MHSKKTSQIVFLIIIVILLLVIYNYLSQPNGKHNSLVSNMEFSIATTWDGQPLNHKAVKVVLDTATNGHDLNIHIEAPFFNDPSNPGGPVGQPFPQLWNYEVVEAFFLNDSNDYLEVELCPHGQHLVLMLHGERNMIKDKLAIHFTATIAGDTWRGDAVIPDHYLPARVSKFNAYAIHGTDPNRVYESLYPVPHGKYSAPDFHKLQYFHSINLQSLVPSIYASDYSSAEWNQVPK